MRSIQEDAYDDRDPPIAGWVGYRVNGQFFSAAVQFSTAVIGVEALVRKVREVLDARAGVLLTKTAG